MHTTDDSRPRPRRRWSALVGAALLAVACAPAAPAAAQPAATAQVTVVHGLRGELVDVYFDGQLLLDAFAPDRLTEPLTVPAGPHTVELRPAGTSAAEPARAIANPVVPGGNVSIVAHFAPDGSWTMSMFTNPVQPLAAGAGRVVFRNTAAVTPVSVALRGAGQAPAIEAGQERAQDVPASAYAVTVGGPDGATLVPDNDIAVDSGAALILYLVGQGEEVIWLSQRIAAGAAAPTAVQAGNSGLAAATSSGGGPLLATLLSGGVAIAVVGAATRRRRGASLPT